MPRRVSASQGAPQGAPQAEVKKKKKFRPDALTPYETLVAGGDIYKETFLRRAASNYDKILSEIVKEMLQQKIASLHYDALNNYVLFAPTMLITLGSAVISIYATSEIVHDPEIKTWLSIIVACLQLVLSVFQSLAKQLDYGAKAGFHRAASTTLRTMYQNRKHARYENRMREFRNAIRYDDDLTDGIDIGGVKNDNGEDTDDSETGDEENGNGKEDGEKDEESEEEADEEAGVDAAAAQAAAKGSPLSDSDSLTNQFKQALSTVDSIVPVRVTNAFNVLETRIRVVNESLLTCKTNSLVAWEQVLMALYYQLSETIISYWGFPFLLPDPESAVDYTLRKFKASIDAQAGSENPADLLNNILGRSNEIAEIQKKVVAERAQEALSERKERQKNRAGTNVNETTSLLV